MPHIGGMYGSAPSHPSRPIRPTTSDTPKNVIGIEATSYNYQRGFAGLHLQFHGGPRAEVGVGNGNGSITMSHAGLEYGMKSGAVTYTQGPENDYGSSVTIPLPGRLGSVALGVGGIGSKEGQPVVTGTHSTTHQYNSITVTFNGPELLHSGKQALVGIGAAIAGGIKFVATHPEQDAETIEQGMKALVEPLIN